MRPAASLAPAGALALALALLGWSCSPTPPRASPGDDGWLSTIPPAATKPARADPHPRAIPVKQRRRWALAAKLGSLDTVGGREPSEHLGGGTDRTVRVNARAARYANLAGSEPMPEGALIVQLQHPPEDDGLIAGFVMLKGPAGSAPARGDWSFVVLDEKLRVEAEGPMPLCTGCHRAAPHDGLFGPPAAVGQPRSEP